MQAGVHAQLIREINCESVVFSGTDFPRRSQWLVDDINATTAHDHSDVDGWIARSRKVHDRSSRRPTEHRSLSFPRESWQR
jgi:hypothetical protein